MPYANVNGARLHYQTCGAGDDLIFLHGAGGNHLSWWQQLPAFAGQFRCLVFDARGWGLSRGDTAVGRWAFGTDLIALMDHLRIDRAHLVAQSMGGRAVAGLARLAPGRVGSLVLSGTTAGATNDRIRQIQDELREVRGATNLREHALGDAFQATQPALSILYRQINLLNPPRPRGMLGRPPPTYRGSMHEALTSLGVPILFIVGEHDRITSPEMIREAAGLVRGSVVCEVAGAAHSAHFEQADEWNREVLAFLARSTNPQR